MTKKRFFRSLALVALMLVINISGAWALPPSGIHSHCVCGDGTCTVGGHSHAAITWNAWSTANALPTEAGYWYLTTDVTLTSTWTPADGTYLCLNGHIIKQSSANNSVIKVNSGINFVLTDCNTTTEHKWVPTDVVINYQTYTKGQWVFNDAATGTPGTDYMITKGGVITGVNGNASGITVKGSFDMFGGNIVGNINKLDSPDSPGALLASESGTVNIFGGRICGNACRWAPGVGVIGTATFNMYGGKIDNNTGKIGGGLYIRTTNEVLLAGGAISSNKSSMGAGVYFYEVVNAKFKMTGGSITANSTGSSTEGGAGILVPYKCGDATLQLLGGSVTGNVSDNSNAFSAGLAFFVNTGGKVILGGEFQMTDNLVAAKQNNFYVKCDYSTKAPVNTIVISQDIPLTGSAKIGITTSVNPTETAPLTVIQSTGGKAVAASDLQYFKSDTSIYKLRFVTDHIELQKYVAHKHCICGDNKCSVGGHTHDKTVVWEEWESTTSLPSTKGYYYLANDVTLTSTWTPADGTYLCLNGHIVKQTGKVPVISVINKQKLTITDCNKTAVHRWVPAASPAVNAAYWTLNDDAKGTVGTDYFTTTGGVITGGKNGFGGGIRVGDIANVNNYGALDFFAGNVVGNANTASDTYSCIGGGIYAARGTFIFYGGRICGNSADLGAGIGIYGSWIKTNMLGGQIDHNYGNQGSGIITSQSTDIPVTEPMVISNVKLTDNITLETNTGCIDHYRNKCWMRLTNVTISNNTGGGIRNGGKLELLSCDVTNNIGEYGVRNTSDEGSELIVGGTTKITGNTTASGNQVNCYFAGKKFAIDTISGLTSGANIGVTPPYAPTLARPITITNGSETDVAYFTSDDASYCVKFNTDHLELAVPVCKNLVTDKGYASIKSAIYDAIDNDTIQMLQNIKENIVFNQRPDTLEILTLDLNGKTLTGLGTSSVIEIGENADLTIMDSQTTGKITGGIGKSQESGNVRIGGAIDNDGGNLTITGGTITGNSCTVTDEGGRAWGGAIANESGTLTITGGTITGNYCSGAFMSWGGGVYNEGTMTMTGGKISNNYVTGNGNKQGGGVANLTDCTFNVGGSAVITNNTIGGAANNVEILYFNGKLGEHTVLAPATGYMTISTDKPFVSGAQIGVSTPVAKPWKITTNGTANDAQYFVSDSTQYAVSFKKNHLELAYPDCEIGGKIYASLQDAATAAKTNDVIDMYENASETDTVVVVTSKKFDINVTNPYKNSSSFINNGDVTVKDGEFAVNKISNKNLLTFNNATVKADSIFSAGASFKFLGSDTIVGAKITGANPLTVGIDASNPAYVAIKGETSLTDLEINSGSVVSFLGNTRFAQKKANGVTVNQGATADLNGNVKVDENSTFTLKGVLNWNLANNPVIEIDRMIGDPNSTGRKTITVDGKMRESQYLGYYYALTSTEVKFYLTGGSGDDAQIVLDGDPVVYNALTYELKSMVTSAMAYINHSGIKTSVVSLVKKSLYLTVRPSNPEIAVTTANKWFKKGDVVKIEGTLKDDSKSGYKSLSVLGLGKTPIDATNGISDNAWSYTYTGPNTKGTDLKFVIMNNYNLTDTASYTLKVDTVAPYAKSVKIHNSQYNNVDYTGQWIVDEENLVVTIQLHDITSGGLNNVTVLCDGTPLVAGTHYSFNPVTGLLRTFKGVFENKLGPTTLSVSAKDLAGNQMTKTIYINFGVCKIGENYYQTIEEAIAQVQSGETIELLTNVVMQKNLELPAGTQLDLKDCTLKNPTGLDLKWDLTDDNAPIVKDFDKLNADGTLTLNMNDLQTRKEYVIASDATGAGGREFILTGAPTADGKDRAVKVGGTPVFYGHRHYTLELEGSNIVLKVKKVTPPSGEFWGVSVDGSQLSLSIDNNYNVSHTGDSFVQEDNLTHFHFNGPITRIGVATLKGNLNLKEVYFPASVEFIGQDAIRDCENLEYANMHDITATAIGPNAFEGCKKLSIVEWPAQLEEIDAFAFAYCESLEDITLPATLQRIYGNAFSYCSDLKSVTLQSPSMERLWAESFDKCHKDLAIYVPYLSLTEYEALSAARGLNFQTKIPVSNSGIGKNTVYCHHNMIIPDGVTFWTMNTNLTEQKVTQQFVPGGAGYVVKFEAGVNSVEVVTTSQLATTIANRNILTGVNKATEVSEILKGYDGTTLCKMDPSTGSFYSFASEMPAYQAFYVMQGGIPVSFTYDEATGIANVDVDADADADADADSYNAAGQKVANGYKGIVIKNGKKYLNK